MGYYRITTIGRANETLKVHGKALKLEVCNVYDGDFHVEVEVSDAGVAFGTGKEGNVGG